MVVDNKIFSCSWDEFGDWIRKQINGDFSWKIRPMDSKQTRELLSNQLRRQSEIITAPFRQRDIR